MSAILHCIITGIENERIKNNIMEWRNKYIIDRPFQTLVEIEGVVMNNLNKTWDDDEEYEETEDGIEDFFHNRCNYFEDINYLFGNKANTFDKIKPALVLQIIHFMIKCEVDMMGYLDTENHKLFDYSLSPEGMLENMKEYLVYWIGMDWRRSKIHNLICSDEDEN